MSDAADFQQALQQFRDDYAAQVPLRLAEARQFLQQAIAEPGDRAPLRALHGVIHKLAGSAGTFGLRALSEAARALEDELDALLAQPAVTREQLQSLVARLPTP